MEKDSRLLRTKLPDPVFDNYKEQLSMGIAMILVSPIALFICKSLMNTEKQKTEIDTVTTANTIDKLREYEETPGMNELISNLNMIQGSYLSFVIGAASYASKKPERLIAVTNYLNSSDSLTASDVVEFILDQPDFFEDCVEPSANRR